MALCKYLDIFLSSFFKVYSKNVLFAIWITKSQISVGRHHRNYNSLLYKKVLWFYVFFTQYVCILCSITHRLDAQDTAQFFRLLNYDHYVQEQVTANSEFVLSVLHQFRLSFEKCLMLDQAMNSLTQEKVLDVLIPSIFKRKFSSFLSALLQLSSMDLCSLFFFYLRFCYLDFLDLVHHCHLTFSYR